MAHSRYQSGPSYDGIGGRLPGGGQPPPGYGGAGGVGFSPFPPQGPQSGFDAGDTLKGIGGRIKGGASDVLRWGTENPEIAGAVLGTGVELWGAHKAGQQADRDREEEQRRYERDQQREDERQRNRARSYQRILDRRNA